MSGFGVFVGLFAMFVSGICMLFCFIMLVNRMVMSRLVVVMGGGVVMSRGCVMMFTRRVLSVCHFGLASCVKRSPSLKKRPW